MEILIVRRNIGDIQLAAQQLADMIVERGQAADADAFPQRLRAIDGDAHERGGTIARCIGEFFDQHGTRMQAVARIDAIARAQQLAQAAGTVQARLQGMGQMACLDRLLQDFIAACGDCIKALADFVAGGHQQDRQGHVFGLVADELDQLEAVHIGQLLVDNQGIGAEIGQRGERRLTIAGKAHGHAALGQPARTLAGADRIHLGEKDAPGRLRGMHEQVIKAGNDAQ